MARRTFGQALADANKLDALWGTQHRSDAVLSAMLERVSSKATSAGTLAKSAAATKATRPDSSFQAPQSRGGYGVGSQQAQKALRRPLRGDADTKLQAVADAAHAAKKPDDGRVRAAALNSMSPEQLAAAVDAAVVAGKISGTDAVELLRRLKAKR